MDLCSSFKFHNPLCRWYAPKEQYTSGKCRAFINSPPTHALQSSSSFHLAFWGWQCTLFSPDRLMACESSPLIPLLEDALRTHSLVKSPDGTVYTGFVDFADLQRSDCTFLPMNLRALDPAVVRALVEANMMQLQERDVLCEFGPISLVVNRSDCTRTFHIIDGQHRCQVEGEGQGEGERQGEEGVWRLALVSAG